MKSKTIPETADEINSLAPKYEIGNLQDLRKAPCENWRIILALARYGGLRSHETRIQKWEDIDLPNNTMLVR